MTAGRIPIPYTILQALSKASRHSASQLETWSEDAKPLTQTKAAKAEKKDPKPCHANIAAIRRDDKTAWAIAGAKGTANARHTNGRLVSRNLVYCNSEAARVGIADGIDPQLTAVTFWVYPDSFDLFRKLRDHLYERGLDIAGRPLPPDAPIAASKHGTASRGQ